MLEQTLAAWQQTNPCLKAASVSLQECNCLTLESHTLGARRYIANTHLALHATVYCPFIEQGLFCLQIPLQIHLLLCHGRTVFAMLDYHLITSLVLSLSLVYLSHNPIQSDEFADLGVTS